MRKVCNENLVDKQYFKGIYTENYIHKTTAPRLCLIFKDVRDLLTYKVIHVKKKGTTQIRSTKLFEILYNPLIHIESVYIVAHQSSPNRSIKQSLNKENRTI